MQSVVTHSDRWRWYLEIESTHGSTCADNAFPPNGAKIEMEVNCPRSVVCFLHPSNLSHSGVQWEALCTRAKEFWLWIFYLNFTWREKLLYDSVVMSQLYSAWWCSFVSSFSLEWVLVIFGKKIHFQKMRTPQFHKCKIVESLENKQFLILVLHKWLPHDDGRLLWIGHLFLYKTLLLLLIKHSLSFLWVQVNQAYWMQTFNNSELQPWCSLFQCACENSCVYVQKSLAML